eukprot:403358726
MSVFDYEEYASNSQAALMNRQKQKQAPSTKPQSLASQDLFQRLDIIRLSMSHLFSLKSMAPMPLPGYPTQNQQQNGVNSNQDSPQISTISLIQNLSAHQRSILLKAMESLLSDEMLKMLNKHQPLSQQQFYNLFQKYFGEYENEEEGECQLTIDQKKQFKIFWEVGFGLRIISEIEHHRKMEDRLHHILNKGKRIQIEIQDEQSQKQFSQNSTHIQKNDNFNVIESLKLKQTQEVDLSQNSQQFHQNANNSQNQYHKLPSDYQNQSNPFKSQQELYKRISTNSNDTINDDLLCDLADQFDYQIDDNSEYSHQKEQHQQQFQLQIHNKQQLQPISQQNSHNNYAQNVVDKMKPSSTNDKQNNYIEHNSSNQDDIDFDNLPDDILDKLDEINEQIQDEEDLIEINDREFYDNVRISSRNEKHDENGNRQLNNQGDSISVNKNNNGNNNFHSSRDDDEFMEEDLLQYLSD